MAGRVAALRSDPLRDGGPGVLSRLAGWIVVGGCCVVAGALISVRPGIAPFLVGAIVILALQGLGSRVLAPLLVVAVFVTHFRVVVAGLHFLPEHFIVLALIVALVVEGKGERMWAVATDRTVLALAALIGWLAFVTLTQAPDPGASMPIIGWLGLDWLMLVAFGACFRGTERLERIAVSSNTVLAGVAVLLGVVAAVSSSVLGTQGGYANNARAVYALSFEANILASTVAIWAFVGISSPHERVRRIARICLPLAIAAIAFSLTRAVIIGFGLGLLAWGLLSGQRGARTAFRIVVATVVAGALLVAVAPSVAAPIQTRFANLLQFEGGTGAHRIQGAQEAISDLHGTNLVTGLGIDSFGQRHEDPTRPGQPAYLGILPLQVVYEGGLVSAILLLYALASLRPLSRPGRGRAVGVFLIFISAATATSPFWFGSTWLLIALALISRPRAPAAEG